jgi:hypothetical protein
MGRSFFLAMTAYRARNGCGFFNRDGRAGETAAQRVERSSS